MILSIPAQGREPGLNTDVGQFSVEFYVHTSPGLGEGWVDFHFPASCAWARTLNRKRSDVQSRTSVYMRKLKKFQPFQRGQSESQEGLRLTRLDDCFHVIAYKHFTAKGIPAAVIQPGLQKATRGRVKRSLEKRRESFLVDLQSVLLNSGEFRKKLREKTVEYIHAEKGETPKNSSIRGICINSGRSSNKAIISFLKCYLDRIQVKELV